MRIDATGFAVVVFNSKVCGIIIMFWYTSIGCVMGRLMRIFREAGGDGSSQWGSGRCVV